MYTLSTSAPSPQQDVGRLHPRWTRARMPKAQHLRAPWEQKGLFLLTGTVLAYKGHFKAVRGFSQGVFPALVFVILFKNSNNKNRASAFFSFKSLEKCCCKETFNLHFS